MKLILKETYGDSNSSYKIKLDESDTVKSFVDKILSEDGRGKIYVSSKGKEGFNYSKPNAQYWEGEAKIEIDNELLSKRVKVAYGGYCGLSYSLQI